MTKNHLLLILSSLLVLAVCGCGQQGNPQQSEADKYPARKALPLDQIKAQEAKAAGHYGPPPSQARPGMAPPHAKPQGPGGPPAESPTGGPPRTSSAPGGGSPVGPG